MSASGGRQGVPAIDFQQLRRDRNVAAANRAIAAMRRGETLCLQYQARRPLWRLSGARPFPAPSPPHHQQCVRVPVDDALFAEMPGQSWRLK